MHNFCYIVVYYLYLELRSRWYLEKRTPLVEQCVMPLTATCLLHDTYFTLCGIL